MAPIDIPVTFTIAQIPGAGSDHPISNCTHLLGETLAEEDNYTFTYKGSGDLDQPVGEGLMIETRNSVHNTVVCHYPFCPPAPAAPPATIDALQYHHFFGLAEPVLKPDVTYRDLDGATIRIQGAVASVIKPYVTIPVVTICGGNPARYKA